MAKTVFEMLRDIITIADRVEGISKLADRTEERVDRITERLIRVEVQLEMAMRAATTKRISREARISE